MLRKSFYKQKKDADCSSRCANNEAERCGKHGLISIYTTHTGKVYKTVTKINI